MKDDFHGLLVAGGAGTRLWPLSRQSYPKQLLRLDGGQHSLLQAAFLRLARTVPPQRIRVVTNHTYDGAVYRQIGEVAPGFAQRNVLSEPVVRDSAPAVLWGALQIAHEAPDAVMAVMWTDQRICNEGAFDSALALAYRTVHEEGLACIGVPANRPSTTLGYIKTGRALGEGVYEAERFIEKPDLLTAERLVAEGTYLWNPGIFVFKVRTLLEEFERYAPAMMGHFHEHAKHLRDNDWSDPHLIEAVFAKLARESIDYLILERTERLRLIPTELDWSDLGTWDELYFQATKDDQGNAVSGNAITLDTRNTYIRGGRRLVATVGVEGLVVIDTDDALLVCDLNRVHDIKHLVERLKQRGSPEVEGFEETVRPWGSYTVLQEGPGFKIKIIEVRPHQKISLQLHRQRAEHWVVLQGRARVTCGEEVRDVEPNEYLFVPCGAKHRIENAGDDPVRIIEVQQGAYLGEDDIVRFDDVYGRV
jgi:mannose-1-phosphate guanylyltransferase / mannose-6-phosphate isomerase